jgi:hypothetical protein
VPREKKSPPPACRKGKDLSNHEGAGARNSARNASQFLKEFFRCPNSIANFVLSRDLSDHSGYFRFGPDVVCYGRCSSGTPSKFVTGPLPDVREHVVTGHSAVQLPFDPVQVVDNLRYERYFGDGGNGQAALPGNRALRYIYYVARPAMGVSVRKHFQRLYFRGRESAPFPKWPVDVTVESLTEQLLVLSMKAQDRDRLPFIWFWPDAARSCTTVSHDVESTAGLDFCPQLMDLDDLFGIKTSFQIVPEERYVVSQSELRRFRERGFEINVHDLNHDGHLFSDRNQFLRRAKRINQYGRKFGAQGFRAAVMYRNLDWFDALKFSYDMSVPNVAHLDPQRGGCCTVFPFFIGRMIELPVTATQDYSLFYILKDYSIRLWKDQIARIRAKNGLISVIIHPDYVIEKAARRVYSELLEFLCELRSSGDTWIARPGEVADWWRLRSKLKLVPQGKSWRIDGQGSERARLAYAVLEGDKLRYEFASDYGSAVAVKRGEAEISKVHRSS